MIRSLQFVAAPVLFLMTGCDRASTPPIASPQVVEVSVNARTFVNPYSNTAPRLTDLDGLILVRMELTPAEQPDARTIYDTCRSGGLIVARISKSEIRPFCISAVSDEADALVVVESRERALEILNALSLDPAGSPKIQNAEGVAPQSATRSDSDSEGSDKPQPESDARSR